MTTKVPGIPTPPPNLSPEVRRYLQSVVEILEIRLGIRGDAKDRAITLRELIDAGVVDEAKAAAFDLHNVTAANRGFNAKE